MNWYVFAVDLLTGDFSNVTEGNDYILFQAEHALFTPGLDENRAFPAFTAVYKILYTAVIWKLKKFKQIKGKRTFNFHKLDADRCV